MAAVTDSKQIIEEKEKEIYSLSTRTDNNEPMNNESILESLPPVQLLMGP